MSSSVFSLHQRLSETAHFLHVLRVQKNIQREKKSSAVIVLMMHLFLKPQHRHRARLRRIPATRQKCLAAVLFLRNVVTGKHPVQTSDRKKQTKGKTI